MTRRTVILTRRRGRAAWPLILTAVVIGAALAITTVLAGLRLWLP